MRALRHPAVYWTVAVVLGAIFVYASLDKIAQPKQFAKIVYRYQLLGPDVRLGVVPANALAVTLPWIEIVTGILLITGVWRREAAALTAGLLVMFLTAVSYALAQGIDVGTCGCFSVAEGTGRGLAWTLVGDLGLLVGAVYVAAVPPRAMLPESQAVPVEAGS